MDDETTSREETPNKYNHNNNKKMDRKANLESNGYLAEMNQFHLSAEVERCGWQMS